jgi:glycine/D-amino acid oxidase-like deaminating enzyme/nitrite reductase/ring-hydroxylating ferredoxin subunit
MEAPAQSRSPWMSFPVPRTPPLQGNAHADVCVVGAGIAGLTTAYLAAKKGLSVIVVDDGPIGGGMTARTTAHLSNAIDDRYSALEKVHGEDGTQLAAQSHTAAIEAIEAIAAHEGIDCDFVRLDGYLFLPPNGNSDDLLREYEAALRAGVPGLEWAKKAPIPGIDTGYCLRFPRQGQMHPLKYLSGLAQAFLRLGGRIHSGAHVDAVEGGANPRVLIAGGRRIDCGAIVVATNAPISDRVAIHTKQAPYLTYVVAARVPAGSVETALYWDLCDPYHFVRTWRDGEDELLIVGGEDHKTGQADDSERRFAMLELWMRERFPSAREMLWRWSGQVMETVDGLAFAGRDPTQENVYVITGDSGMGMTHGTLGAIIVVDLVHGTEVPWARLYDPARKPGKAARSYAREAANMAWQYTDWLKPGEVDSPKAIARGAGAVLRRGVHRIAVYRDPVGMLHEFSARCTHLGCVVRWNAAETTWDCKCHGSRFDALGHVVSGPAVRGLDPVDPKPVSGTGFRRPTPGSETRASPESGA